MPSVHVLRPDHAIAPPAERPAQPTGVVRPSRPAGEGHFLFDMLAETWGSDYVGYDGRQGGVCSHRRAQDR